MRIAIVFLAGALATAAAQELKMPPGIDKLAAKADEATEVNLEGPLLNFASRALSDKDPDQAKAKRIVGGLKGIYVRSFEFSKDGQYSLADIDAFRNQFQPPAWSRMVGVKSNKGGDNADVFFKLSSDGDIGGLVVIAAEPKELTIVHIVGTIKPEDIAELSGEFGIPKLDVQKKAPAGKKGKEE